MSGTTLDRARDYLRKGLCPIPIPHREKNPGFDEWPDMRLQEADLPQHFNGRPMNVGVLLGAPSGDLVDIDLDAAEAVVSADLFLPKTSAEFGRAGKPRSHREYVCKIDTEKFADVDKGDDETAMIVEIRSTGGQTVFPGSTHPSGEAVEWAHDGEPAVIDADELRRAVVLLACSAMLARHWPTAGVRHDAALAAAGFLVRANVDDANVVKVVMGAAKAAGDAEWADRKRAALDTVAAIRSGEAATGGPRLAELLHGPGEKVVARLRKWLGIDSDLAGRCSTLTDTGNAQRFVSQHGENVRFVYAWKTWLVWDAIRWRRDAGDAVMRMAKETARSIYAEAAREPNEAKRKALVAFAGRTENEPSLRRLLILAQSEPGIPVTPDQLDADPYVLNTPTGTLELRTLHLRPHRRNDLLTKVTAASYVPGATHPVFDAYRARMLGDGLDAFLARAAGYTLTGSTSEEKLFFCHGVTASGKTTLTKAMVSALGDYAMTADFTSFLEGRNGDGPRNDIARLAGARMVVSVEVQDGSRLAEGLLKLITGGDRVTARFLYGENFEFVPAFKLWLVANDRPRARDTDDALWRRLLEIPFTERLGESERDPAVKATLCDPAQAGPAVLAWAADGAAAWFASGLGVPDVVRRATEGYRASMDPLADFLADCCELLPDAAVTAKRLREAYEAWARETGLRPVSGRVLAQRLEGRGCERLRRHGGERWWVGVQLRGEDPKPETSPW